MHMHATLLLSVLLFPAAEASCFSVTIPGLDGSAGSSLEVASLAGIPSNTPNSLLLTGTPGFFCNEGNFQKGTHKRALPSAPSSACSVVHWCAAELPSTIGCVGRQFAPIQFTGVNVCNHLICM